MSPDSNDTEIEGTDHNLKILMGLLSHDINNHIYGSMGYLELVQSLMKGDPRLSRYLSNSMFELRSISQLVDNVRLLVNISKEPYHGEPVDVYQTVMLSMESARYQVDQKKIRIDLSFGEKECIVEADRFLQDLFSQLLMNSMKYSKGDEASININMMIMGGMVNLIYEDDGKGIPDALKGTVFTRFDRSIRDGDVQGKGMGLSVVNSVISRYGGTISLEDIRSDGEVIGTRFLIKVPEWTG